MNCHRASIRARNLGIPLSGTPGPLNAITDVAGVEVGYATLWRGEGELSVGAGPVRTGLTAILPRGRKDPRPCFGGAFALNAAGEFTGLSWLEERGSFEGPVLLTNTHSLGTVRDAAIQWMFKRGWPRLVDYVTPIVGETYDGFFNDIDGGHVKAAHVFEALDSARDGMIAEGNVGGGTGMISYWYKGGTGTASRRLPARDGGYTLGVLVQSNYGLREHIRIAGIPMGAALSTDLPRYLDCSLLSEELRNKRAAWCEPRMGEGSIIVVVVTDAPLLPHQLKRLAKRPSMGMARLGGIGTALSGDMFLALSTANANIGERPEELSGSGNGGPYEIRMHSNLALNPLFEAAIDATEEAILNALVAADAAEGANRLYVPRLPHSRVQAVLRAHHLLSMDDSDQTELT